jgi:rare lipoprotein A
MPIEPRTHPRRLRRLLALRRLRIRKRHLRGALLATTPGAMLFGGGLTMPTVAVPVAIAATLPAAPALAEIVPPLLADPEVVEASYYGDEFAGRPTASGEPFDPDLHTAAHRTLPLGTLVQVVDAGSGRSVTVRVNDRGPFHGNRVIDLSRSAAEQIGMLAQGTGRVTLHLLQSPPVSRS